MGGLIRVLNTRSRRTIHARIVAPDRVVVESDLPMQLAHTLN
jgi:flagella basal body P-ring formation protein FlgA